MNGYSKHAIRASLDGIMAFCKFLSANDTGETGGHQSGIYISKPSIPILFDKPGKRGENRERWVSIDWQNGSLKTFSRFVYYGQGTRNEYRITNFGKGFPYLKPVYTGALFVLIKKDETHYQSFVLNTENEINDFLIAFGLTPTQTNCLIDTDYSHYDKEEVDITIFSTLFEKEFPSSNEMSLSAREIWYKSRSTWEAAEADPDTCLVEWTNLEYRLYRSVEHARYDGMIKQGFDTVEDFLSVANKVLNRRKSRAGKSLEHHIAALLDINGIQYTPQAVTEGNKRPDFIFPSEEAYHDMSFPENDLISLAAKTTCKDRWRQIINEADRLRNNKKYLCTLQQGISVAQMDEMDSEGVVLVVPKAYISTYPNNRRDRIWTIKQFIEYAKEMEGII